jgi:hypothetical protein
MTDTQIFAFERDFASSLRCIPMAVRLKLDLSGIKLSLRQWSRFSADDRHMLLNVPCESDEEIEDYRIIVIELVALRADELAKNLDEDVDSAQWNNTSRVPIALREFAAFNRFDEPTVAQWAALTRLQRFALLKLTRDHHDNINFGPAMYEFGLAERESRAVA